MASIRDWGLRRELLAEQAAQRVKPEKAYLEELARHLTAEEGTQNRRELARAIGVDDYREPAP